MFKNCILLQGLLFFICISSYSQDSFHWENINDRFGNLPDRFNVYFSSEKVGDSSNRMYYVSVPLQTNQFDFQSDTSSNRRLTSYEFYVKNDSPLVVVNAGFFSFSTHQNLNLVADKGKIVAYNSQSIAAKAPDEKVRFVHPFYGAFGIDKKGKPDVAFTLTDSTSKHIWASQSSVEPITDSRTNLKKKYLPKKSRRQFSKWKMKTAVGGGPVLIQAGEVQISNNQERKFAGNALYDRHPRTAIGYTSDNKLIIFVCEGRSKVAAGLSLPQMAEILKDLGCVEALNLDGGGSTTLLVKGKEVNRPSSGGVQRMVPSVFMVREK